MAKVTTIPATIHKFNSNINTNQLSKRKVAGYARVSTDSSEQATSYEAQVDYYQNYIKNRDDWEYVNVYTDEGISGTSTKHRAGFNKMVEDALDGKFSLIITKSVSRFARNTVDSLTTIRKLKEKGVECYFEKENIWTFDGKGELLLTIMSSLAQEESRSISENVKWGHRKRFADGKVTIPYSRFLGYDKGEDGNLAINEKEAVVVRKIYQLFIKGLTITRIARQLTEEKIPTPAGKEKWSSLSVKSILTNEKYKGDALLQKRFTVDFLTKEKKYNKGELPQYYVKNNHEGIVSNEVFEMVQNEMERRKSGNTKYRYGTIFCSKIICSECGSFYGRKVLHSTSSYRKHAYMCNNKFSNEVKCTTPTIKETELIEMFVNVVNSLIRDKKEIIANIKIVQKTILNNKALEREKEIVLNKFTYLTNTLQDMMNDNAKNVQNQKTYQDKYTKLMYDYEDTKSKLAEIEHKIADNISRKASMDFFAQNLKEQKRMITEFDEQLYATLIYSIVVHTDRKVEFVLRDGSKIIV